MAEVKVLKRCVVNEYRYQQHLSWRYADPGETLEIGAGVNGFRREVAPADGTTLVDLGYDLDRWARLCNGLTVPAVSETVG